MSYQSLVALLIKSMIFGILTSFLSFCMIQTSFINNIYTMILINSVVAGNLYILILGRYLLIIDNSKNKCGIVLIIFIQIIVAIAFIICIQIFDTSNFLFVMVGTYKT